MAHTPRGLAPVPARAGSRRGWLLAAGAAVLALGAVALGVSRRRRTVNVVQSEDDEPRPKRKRPTECQGLASLVERVDAAEDLPGPRLVAAELTRLQDGLEVHAPDAPWKDEAREALGELAAAARAEANGQPHAPPTRWDAFVVQQADRCPEVARVVSDHGTSVDPEPSSDGGAGVPQHGSP